MTEAELNQLRFPIGRFKRPSHIDQSLMETWKKTIQQFPNQLAGVTESLDDRSMAWTYRPDGWSIRQVVHHCADSHLNSFVRFKLALTENEPTIKAYFEDKWAELPDSTDAPIDDSIQILTGIHARWTILLKNLSDKDFEKSVIHPEHNRAIPLKEFLALYAWHCDHHLAHVEQAIHHKGKF